MTSFKFLSLIFEEYVSHTLNVLHTDIIVNIIQIWTGPSFNMEKYGTAKTYYIDRGPRSI